MTPVSEQCSATAGDMGLSAFTNEVNNYAFTSTLALRVTPVMPNTELFINWAGLTQDFVGHPVDPKADIDMVSMVVWKLSQQELVQKLNEDDLGSTYAESAIAMLTMNAVDSASIFDFEVAGGGELPREELMARLDPTIFDPATTSYTVMAHEGGVLTEGSKMVAAVQLDPASTNQTIVVDSTSTTLTYAADIQTLTRLSLPEGRSDITLDWSMMMTNGLGRTFTKRSINEVMVAQYLTLTPADLEAEFLDLELIADKMYRGQVTAGDKLSLSTLVDAAGQPFTGIDANGTWIVALMCGGCANPAPWFLSTLARCPG
jgi:hypothetical protein